LVSVTYREGGACSAPRQYPGLKQDFGSEVSVSSTKTKVSGGRCLAPTMHTFSGQRQRKTANRDSTGVTSDGVTRTACSSGTVRIGIVRIGDSDLRKRIEFQVDLAASRRCRTNLPANRKQVPTNSSSPANHVYLAKTPLSTA
jgi:hypothetical protein